MTKLTYICTDKRGNKFEVKTYSEALKVKGEGGSYVRHYEEDYKSLYSTSEKKCTV